MIFIHMILLSTDCSGLEGPVRGFLYGQLLGVLGNVHAPLAEKEGMRVVWIMIAMGVILFVAQLSGAYFLGIVGDGKQRHNNVCTTVACVHCATFKSIGSHC